jgi:hypothetical protein
MSKNRKICEENRSFRDKWENEFLFINDEDSKPQRLAYLQVLSMHKEYNLKRNYTQHYAATYQEYVGQGRINNCMCFEEKG